LADFKDCNIFVSKVEGETVDATNRLKKLIESFRDEIDVDSTLKKDLFKLNKPEEKNLSKHLDWLLSKLIDVRFFGATMPLKNEGGKGASITFTGPIQFNWGYSLNKVVGPMESSAITSTFAGAKEDYSTMGKDYRVNYSLIAFHGIISANRAKSTMLTNSDIAIFDNAILKSIPLEATTRSKTGQSPLLYIRVEYNNSEYLLGDLRKYLKIVDEQKNELSFDNTSNLRSPKEYSLDISELCAKLKSSDSKIQSIHFWKDSDFKVVGYKPHNEQKIVKL
jgi:CRISPR-associated protein Csh2